MVAQSPPPAGQQPGASLSDLLTAVKNLVIALNGATTAFKQVNGLSTLEGITGPTVVKATSGRVASVSVIVAGSAAGAIYDSASLTQTNQLWVIPATAASTGEPYVVNLPCDSGILVVPGSGQILSLSWS
jgi:hypothetical protein